jgi:ABC-type sugar transport system ATPase subunit
MEPIIELRNLTKRFPSTLALDRVSFDIHPGEVHALVGENGAGKSTLINILSGELRPDSGNVIFAQRPVTFASPVDSQRLGISVVYQELALCPNLSVAENICLSAVAGQRPLAVTKRGEMAERAREALQRLGLAHLDPKTPVRRLDIAKQQLVEIAKAISTDVRVLVLDEPNSALTGEESKHLFDVIRSLRGESIAILYVSHRLDEVLEISDRITVMRDGQFIETVVRHEATVEGLIRKMVGRNVAQLFGNSAKTERRPQEALRVTKLSDPSLLNGVHFTLYKGEILGVAGLPGAGKEELVEALFGLRPHNGEVHLEERSVGVTSVAEAIKQGMVLIPADRRGAGAMLVMNIRENIAASSLARVSRRGFLRRDALNKLALDYMKSLDVRAAGSDQRMGTLSGGNQQKVILARALATNPKVLVLHEPTRGIDVGAKAEIYGLLHRLAAEGLAVLVISSEMPELMGQCDRILVLHRGEITGLLDQREFDEERILACAMGHATFGTLEA